LRLSGADKNSLRGATTCARAPAPPGGARRRRWFRPAPPAAPRCRSARTVQRARRGAARRLADGGGDDDGGGSGSGGGDSGGGGAACLAAPAAHPSVNQSIGVPLAWSVCQSQSASSPARYRDQRPRPYASRDHAFRSNRRGIGDREPPTPRTEIKRKRVVESHGYVPLRNFGRERRREDGGHQGRLRR